MESNIKGIGILANHNISYIDHLVPLCQILGFPLLVTEPWIATLVELYYPPMEVVLVTPEDYSLDEALAGYEFFVYVDFYRKGNGTFQFVEYTTRNKARSLFSFHGHPDKWESIYWLEKIVDEDLVLLYGPRMIEMLRQKGIEKEGIVCGNYRLAFYEEHRPFFDAKLPFEKGGKTVLYAPTWDAPNKKSEYRYNYSSFFAQHQEVFARYGGKSQLIVKLHPNLIHRMGDEVDRVKENFPHITFLDTFPLIYPLLNVVDLYVGDYSSIGYDFLYFDRPMELIGKEKTYLKEVMERPKQEIYREIFGEPKSLGEIREVLCRSIS